MMIVATSARVAEFCGAIVLSGMPLMMPTATAQLRASFA